MDNDASHYVEGRLNDLEARVAALEGGDTDTDTGDGDESEEEAEAEPEPVVTRRGGRRRTTPEPTVSVPWSDVEEED